MRSPPRTFARASVLCQGRSLFRPLDSPRDKGGPLSIADEDNFIYKATSCRSNVIRFTARRQPSGVSAWVVRSISGDVHILSHYIKELMALFLHSLPRKFPRLNAFNKSMHQGSILIENGTRCKDREFS